MIDDYTRMAIGLDDIRRFDEVRRQITLGDEMRRVVEVQRQIALGNEMRRLDEAHKQVALIDETRPSIDQLSPLESIRPKIDQFSPIERIAPAFDRVSAISSIRPAFDQLGALEGIKPAIDQLSILESMKPLIDQSLRSSESVRRSLEGSAILADANNRLQEIHQTWDRIGRSLEYEDHDEPLPSPIQVPDLASEFERALDARATRDRKFQNQQSRLLSSIVEAGKNQNEIMTEIAKLQGLLVKEALANSRIQRVVLWFAALSATLALIALIK